MTINLTSGNFTLNGGLYYSSAFIQNSDDSFMTVAIWTSESSTASMQASLNEVDWIDVANTSFTVSNAGLQTFVECHLGLKYRIKIDHLPIKAQILI